MQKRKTNTCKIKKVSFFKRDRQFGTGQRPAQFGTGAFRNYFQKRAGFPKLKTKKNIWQSYTTNNQQHTIYLVDDQLKLPKLKSFVAVKRHRPINGQIKSATISARNNTGILYFDSLHRRNSALAEEPTKDCLGLSSRSVGRGQCTVTLYQYQCHQISTKAGPCRTKTKCESKSCQTKKMVLSHARNYQKQKGKVSQLYRAHRDQKEYIDQVTFHLVKQYDTIFFGTADRWDL